MRILALETVVPGVPEEAFTDELLKREAAKAWELHQSGVIRELYFRQDRRVAVLVLECNDADEARRVLGSLPLVQRNLISFEVIPLIAYDGFSRLFKPR
jgi:muconolactone delta-isomerase